MRLLLVVIFTSPLLAQTPLLHSREQKEYLFEIRNQPLSFQAPTSDALMIMNRAEGYLAKNMVALDHVSPFAIQGRVRSTFISLSRLDLQDDTSEFEMFISLEPGYRPNIAGVTYPYLLGTAALVKDRQRRVGMMVATSILSVIAQKEAEAQIKKEIADSLRYSLFFAQITMKFLRTGVPYPSATVEEILESNIQQQLITLEEATNLNLKKERKFKADSDTDPMDIVRICRRYDMTKVKYLALEYDSKDQIKAYYFYDPPKK